MPVDRLAISHSQLADLLGLEPAVFVAIERATRGGGPDWYVVTERNDMNTSGTFPQLTKGGKKICGKKGGKRGC